MVESQTSPLRHSRLQFSLRLLLLGLTAFAIGFPIWYRWPYEETEYQYPGGDATKPPDAVAIKTWRRTWGGGRVQSGRAITEYKRRATKTIYHFVNGKRNGPFESWRDGNLVYTGQYVNDQAEGTWVEFDNGQVSQTANWHQGRLDGVFELALPNQRLRFSRGRLTEINGEPAQDHLRDQLESHSIDNSEIAAALDKVMPVGIEFVECPLKDGLGYLQDQCGIPFVLDSRRVKPMDLPITLRIRGADLCSSLALLIRPHGLTVVYRYGVLYVTTAESAKDWRDPTGVSGIQPAAGSDIERAWNELTQLEAVESTLDVELQRLAQPLAIEIDTTRIAPSEDLPQGVTLTANLKGLPFRHVLALLLDKTGCTCRLEGERLVILPP